MFLGSRVDDALSANHRRILEHGDRFSVDAAEREGFEPSMDGTAHTGFRDRRIQPLCHLSGCSGLTG